MNLAQTKPADHNSGNFTSVSNACSDVNHTISAIPVSISSYRSYGVRKSSLHSACINQFSINTSLQDCFEAYYLKYWRGEYLLDQIEDGAMVDSGRTYLVIYQNCTPFQVRKCAQVRLSFRSALPEYEIPAYVIVKLAL